MAESRSVLTYNLKKVIASDKEVAVQQEKFIWLLLSSKIEYVRVEFEDYRRLYYIFDGEEIRDLETKFKSGEPIMLDFNNMMFAMDVWRGNLNMLRNLKNSRPAARRATSEVLTTPVSEKPAPQTCPEAQKTQSATPEGA